MDIKLHTPLTREDTAKLTAGDYVYLSGTIYTARDAAHARMNEALDRGESLPVDWKNNIVYYLGPTPARSYWFSWSNYCKSYGQIRT